MEVSDLTDYKKLYFHLFSVIADAVESIEHANYGTAKEILVKAQQEAEEEYMDEA